MSKTDIYYKIFKNEILKLLKITQAYDVILNNNILEINNKKIYMNNIEYYINVFELWYDRLPNKNLITQKQIIDQYLLIKSEDPLKRMHNLFTEYLKEKIEPSKIEPFDESPYIIYNPVIVPIIPIIQPKLKNSYVELGIEGVCRVGISNPTIAQCWMNTGLQMLLSIPEIRSGLKNVILRDSDINIDEIDRINIYLLQIDNIPYPIPIKEKITKIRKNLSELIDKNKSIKLILALKALLDKSIELQNPTSVVKYIVLRDIIYNGSDVSEILYNYFIKLGSEYRRDGPREIGRQDDVTMIMNLINLFNFDNPILYGLYKILTFNLNQRLQCIDIGSIRTQNHVATHIIIKDINGKSANSIQEFINIHNETQLNQTKVWEGCIDKNDRRNYNEVYKYQILSDTRYLFIQPKNFIFENGNIIRQREYTLIDSSITIDTIKFNLFGVCIYDSDHGLGGHYVYQLYHGDGTFNIAGLYNDHTYTPTPPNSYIDIHCYAYLVVYRRV